MKKLMALLLLVPFVVGCDRSVVPTAPEPTPEPQVRVQIVSVEGQPVPGASVWIWGFDSMTTDGSGSLLLPPGAVPVSDAEMHITAPGYQERFTKYRKGGPFTMLPLQGEARSEYFQELIFGQYSPGGKLTLMTAKTASVLFGNGIQGDREEAARAATRDIQALVGDKARFTNEPGGEATFTVELNPGDPQARYGIGLAYRSMSGNRIVGGTVVITDRSYAIREVIAHELGHMLGFSHSGHAGDRMNPYLSRTGEFSWKERLAAMYLLQRPAGTQFPDDDRNVPVAAASIRTDLVVCR